MKFSIRLSDSCYLKLKYVAKKRTEEQGKKVYMKDVLEELINNL